MMRCLFFLWTLCLIYSFETSRPALGRAKPSRSTADLPAWVKDVGARGAPEKQKLFSVNSFGANADGTTNSTRAIQKAIDYVADDMLGYAQRKLAAAAAT